MDATGSRRFELTLRGFSPGELSARAERRCSEHFGSSGYRLEECTCVPCLCSLGGHVRLYEAHVVALAPAEAHGTPAAAAP